jgi:hypothetical protein
VAPWEKENEEENSLQFNGSPFNLSDAFALYNKLLLFWRPYSTAIKCCQGDLGTKPSFSKRPPSFSQY